MKTTKHTIILSEDEIQQVIDALIFTNCCDACMDHNDDTVHKKNMEGLRIAKFIKTATGINASQNVYVTSGMIYEDEKEVDFLKGSFNIREE